MSSWVKLHRKIKEWDWYRDIPTKNLFMHILISVNYQKGEYKGRVIEQGQMWFGWANIAYESGLSVQQAKTAMIKLKSTRTVTTKSTNAGSILTVLNWESYQGEQQANPSKINKQSTPKSNNIQEVKNRRTTTLSREGDLDFSLDFEKYESFAKENWEDKDFQYLEFWNHWKRNNWKDKNGQKIGLVSKINYSFSDFQSGQKSASRFWVKSFKEESIQPIWISEQQKDIQRLKEIEFEKSSQN